MPDYQTFTSSITLEVQEFKKRQADATSREEAREALLLERWQEKKNAEALHQRFTISPLPPGIIRHTTHHCVVLMYSPAVDLPHMEGHTVKSSLTATVWKITCEVGDIVQSAEDVLVIMEAMKTEVSVEAGEDNVGRKVCGFGKDVRPGGLVQAGEVLISLD